MGLFQDDILTKLLRVLKPLDTSGKSVKQIRSMIRKDPEARAHFDKLTKNMKSKDNAIKARRKSDKTFDAIYGMLDNYLGD
jgi:hypothetical protein